MKEDEKGWMYIIHVRMTHDGWILAFYFYYIRLFLCVLFVAYFVLFIRKDTVMLSSYLFTHASVLAKNLPDRFS